MDRNVIQTQVCSCDDLSAEIREQLFSSKDHICISGDRIYLLIQKMVFCLPNDPAGNEMAYAILHRNKKDYTCSQNIQDIYESLLLDPDYHPDLSVFRKYKISQTCRRCVTVFKSFSTPEKDLYSIVLSMVPAETGDIIIPVDYRTAVFIKNLEGQSTDEMREFVEAAIDTMEAEGIIEIKAAIGKEYTDINRIRSSYLEAVDALSMGMRYHSRDRVYIYEKQTLERIVDSIPETRKREILDAFFGPETANGLPDEMLETVRVFFRNDLNLTAASKQLYIHRNTLNYRLDKIKKDYGLDLRSFQDAVVFRIISEIANKS